MSIPKSIIQTKVVWKDAFQVVGEKIRFDPSEHATPSDNAIARLWPRFSDRVGEIAHITGGAYGLCLFGPDCVPGGPFDYMAAVGVSRADHVPEGMEAPVCRWMNSSRNIPFIPCR